MENQHVLPVMSFSGCFGVPEVADDVNGKQGFYQHCSEQLELVCCICLVAGEGHLYGFMKCVTFLVTATVH